MSLATLKFQIANRVAGGIFTSLSFEAVYVREKREHRTEYWTGNAKITEG